MGEEDAGHGHPLQEVVEAGNELVDRKALDREKGHRTVDLRQQGKAVPLVDDVATVELDLWAGDQGLTKIRTNVLGF